MQTDLPQLGEGARRFSAEGWGYNNFLLSDLTGYHTASQPATMTVTKMISTSV